MVKWIDIYSFNVIKNVFSVWFDITCHAVCRLYHFINQILFFYYFSIIECYYDTIWKINSLFHQSCRNMITKLTVLSVQHWNVTVKHIVFNVLSIFIVFHCINIILKMYFILIFFLISLSKALTPPNILLIVADDLGKS